jgi:hypothetical protein
MTHHYTLHQAGNQVCFISSSLARFQPPFQTQSDSAAGWADIRSSSSWQSTMTDADPPDAVDRRCILEHASGRTWSRRTRSASRSVWSDCQKSLTLLHLTRFIIYFHPRVGVHIKGLYTLGSDWNVFRRDRTERRSSGPICPSQCPN